ncbi:MAG: SLC13 family permease, partial [bacterium]|nr:SLC13 family permease [bacterium]
PLDRKTVAERYALERRLQTVEVPQESLLAGQSLLHARLGEGFQLMVLGIVRKGASFVLPDPDLALEAGDLLLVKGRSEDFNLIDALQELELGDPGSITPQHLESELVGIAEATLSPRTELAGHTVRELDFRKSYGVSILAIWRDGEALYSDLRDKCLYRGDAFLVYGERRRLDRLAKDPNFYLPYAEPREVRRPKKAAVSCGIMAAVVAAVSFGLLPIYVAAPVGAVLMVLTGCLEMSDTHTFIDLRAILLIAGMLAVGLAMKETGAATMVADAVLGPAAMLGDRFVLAALFAITVAAAQVMPTAGAAVLMIPIAMSTAGDLGLSPRALLMVVAVGSSCAFLSPVGHPANLLVMGFGGYRFTDYTRAGLPLVLLLMLVVVFVLPIFWPL